MVAKGILGVFTLLVFGITTLWFAAVPPSTIRQAAPVAHLGQTYNHLFPAPVDVHSFGLNTRMGMDVLDQSAEIIFDN